MAPEPLGSMSPPAFPASSGKSSSKRTHDGSLKSQSTAFSASAINKLDEHYGDGCWQCEVEDRGENCHIIARKDKAVGILYGPTEYS